MHKSVNDFDTEVAYLQVARAMMRQGITGFQTPARESRSRDCHNSMHYLCNGCFTGWLQHNPREKLQTLMNKCIQCDASHPKTRNNGMAGPMGGKNAQDVELQSKRAKDVEPWFTVWEVKKGAYTGFVKNAKCTTLSAVMQVMVDKTAISKTEVAPSRFVLQSAKGKQHSGLFVKAGLSLRPGDVCAVMCSNQKRKKNPPSDRQSYHIRTVSRERRGYYLLFSIQQSAMIIGAAANAHFHATDPASNAEYKQLPITINGNFYALTVLVATRKISGGCEVVMNYGDGFSQDITEPLDVNGQDDEDDEDDDEDDDDEEEGDEDEDEEEDDEEDV